MPIPKLNIIGELINNSYARARRAFTDRDVTKYQELAKGQSALGAAYLTVNLDGTQRISVRAEEMLEFLPEVVPALQEATTTPLAFDNPSVDYHRVALAHYDASKSGRPILNSLAASRTHLDEMIGLVKDHDTRVVVMASEYFTDEGGSQCLDPRDSHSAAKRFIDMLATQADRQPDDIIIDVGLAPVGADTYGLINIGLDAMKLITADPDLKGVHFIVGLSNFAWGTPKGVREQLENAYLTIAGELGLDYALANVEKQPAALPADDPLVAQLRDALEQGRRQGDETQEQAGFRQAEAIMAICAANKEDEDDDWDD
ncbi:dihydropteroate synthase [Actomonas aquatica]|uniref:Dihydropteroate synthase n=1 Tax=Actomonas aquatica TaxID=2866162 RepID=A0ABZ1C307_9BACT|nr:dihydropteroate synthase [Opitutus sp. WL0086]WRQ85866.1 dihydropteroate synthase [Opitutus sp. WL0086]